VNSLSPLLSAEARLRAKADAGRGGLSAYSDSRRVPLTRRFAPTSPRRRQGLSREKSRIDELQLIGMEFGFRFARIDWWRAVDFRESIFS